MAIIQKIPIIIAILTHLLALWVFGILLVAFFGPGSWLGDDGTGQAQGFALIAITMFYGPLLLAFSIVNIIQFWKHKKIHFWLAVLYIFTLISFVVWFWTWEDPYEGTPIIETPPYTYDQDKLR